MKKVLFSLAMAILCITMHAQELTIKSLEYEVGDLTASISPRKDANDEYCALLKVLLPREDVKFEGNIVDISFDGSEYHVYITSGTKIIQIKCPGFKTVRVFFGDYLTDEVHGKCTYRLDIELPQQPTVETPSVSHTDNGSNDRDDSSYGSSNSSSSGNNYSYEPTYRKTRTPFNHSFNRSKSVSWSLGYVQKQWVCEDDNGTTRYGIFPNNDYVHGLQVGIRINPQFGYGFAMNTGVFYEYYFARIDDQYEDEWGDYHKTYEESSFYVPLHFKYDLNFYKWLQVSFYAGVGLDYSLGGVVYSRADDETLGSYEVCGDGMDRKNFNVSFEYGVSLRMNCVQLGLSASSGLLDMSSKDASKVKQNKLFNASISFYF